MAETLPHFHHLDSISVDKVAYLIDCLNFIDRKDLSQIVKTYQERGKNEEPLNFDLIIISRFHIQTQRCQDKGRH